MVGRATVGSLSLSLSELLFPISFSSQQSVAIVCGSWAFQLRGSFFSWRLYGISSVRMRT
jgi:hypothetical protein